MILDKRYNVALLVSSINHRKIFEKKDLVLTKVVFEQDSETLIYKMSIQSYKKITLYDCDKQKVIVNNCIQIILN